MSSGKEVQKWADDFMFEAEDIDPARGPEVWLLACNPDPLGSIAAAAKAYKGEFVKSLAEITDQERRYYLEQVQKTALAMPLESVNFHFRISGVTRGFTHQMVRQRTAAYSQESTRFAVKSGVPVGLPPSLAGCNDKSFRTVTDVYIEGHKQFPRMSSEELEEYARKHSSQKAKWYETWCETVEHIADAYNKLVDAGMPAEDARGLLPTNLLTQINYFTNLRNFKAEAGKRLCTQAQFEWRVVFGKMMQAIREYGYDKTYSARVEDSDATMGLLSSSWQFDELSDLFRPICYYEGKCQFLAEFDRKCSIRDRVQANAAINRPSSEWHEDQINEDSYVVKVGDGSIAKEEKVVDLGVPAIHPQEWLLDPGAAR